MIITQADMQIDTARKEGRVDVGRERYGVRVGGGGGGWFREDRSAEFGR